MNHVHRVRNAPQKEGIVPTPRTVLTEKQMIKLLAPYRNGRPPIPVVYNIRTGEAGVLVTPGGEKETWCDVVVDGTPPTQVTWFSEHCVPEWMHVFGFVATFIKDHITPVWNACDTLGMYDDAERVYRLACALSEGQGEAFDGELLDTLTTWTMQDPVTKTVYALVYDYVIDKLNA